MPSYRVLKQGFFGGRLYDPKGKRRVLHTEEAFKKVPSWLESIKTEAPAQSSQRKQAVSDGPSIKVIKLDLDALGVEYKSNDTKAVLLELLETAKMANKVEEDKQLIAGASFMSDSPGVETL